MYLVFTDVGYAHLMPGDFKSVGYQRSFINCITRDAALFSTKMYPLYLFVTLRHVNLSPGFYTDVRDVFASRCQ